MPMLAFGEDFDENFFGSNGIQRLQHWLKQHRGECPQISDDTRLGSPICRPSKIDNKVIFSLIAFYN